MFFTDLITYVKKHIVKEQMLQTREVISEKAYANEGISPLS